jgi:hypothetical protein
VLLLTIRVVALPSNAIWLLANQMASLTVIIIKTLIMMGILKIALYNQGTETIHFSKK